MLLTVFHALGYALEELDQRLSGKPLAAEPPNAAAAAPDAAGAGPGAAGPPADTPSARPHDAADEVPDAVALIEDMGAAVGVAMGGWLLARLLRPRAVSWPRALVAGVAATAVSDLVHHLERRLAGIETPPGEPEEAPAETLLRYATGLGTTVAYASVIYPRLPGPPLTRGLTFGLLEAAAAPHGGTIAVLRRAAPQLSFPLERLALPPSVRVSPFAHVAFGLTLGLLYRDGARKARKDR